MRKQHHGAILLTAGLLIAAVAVYLFSAKVSYVEDLRVTIGLLSLIDIGFVAALIWGLRSSETGIRLFSIIANSIFFAGLTVLILLLMLAQGISEP